MRKYVALILIGLFNVARGQDTTVLHTFTTLEQLIAFSDQASLDLIVDNIRLTQARQYERTSKLGIFDPTLSLPNKITHNTNLPVTLLPAEVFGGEPGTNVQLRVGVPYTTDLTQSLDVQLYDAGAWVDYKLAKINTAINESNGKLNRQILQENLADSYYSIVSLQRQLESTQESLTSADSILTITRNKFEQGQVSQQDLNNAEVNKLNTENTLKQIDYMLVDAYLTLKILCNIQDEDRVTISHEILSNSPRESSPEVKRNLIQVKGEQLNQAYYWETYRRSRLSFLPSLSFQAGNSFQLNNETFQPFTGDWINSNYIALSLNFNLSISNHISTLQQTKLDYEIATVQVESIQQSIIIEQKRLENNYANARSEYVLTEKIQKLNQDSYQKNLNLYHEGLISVDLLLDSYEAMVNSSYNVNAAAISLELAYAKILINNKFN